MTSLPLQLGTKVPTLGKIEMVGLTGGERYYWLVDRHGAVSMMPWFMVEPLVRSGSSATGDL